MVVGERVEVGCIIHVGGEHGDDEDKWQVEGCESGEGGEGNR